MSEQSHHSYSYKAFISYRRNPDLRVAIAIQSALHRITKPWYKLRAIRVFLDKTDLTINPRLWSSIQQGMSESEYLLFLASPQSAESQWVRREVDHWINNRPLDKVLIILTDGDIGWDTTLHDFDWNKTNSLPKNFQRLFAEEPLYLDLRWARTTEDLSLRHPQFKEAMAELLARLQNREKSEIISEDVRQYRLARRLARAAVATLTFFLLVTGVAASVAFQQRNSAFVARNNAEQAALREKEAREEAIKLAQAERMARDAADRSAIAERNAKDSAEQRRLEAEKQTKIAKRQTELAEQRRLEEQRQRESATARQFAAQANASLLNNQIDLALLLSLKALKTNNNFDARASLLTSLEHSPHLMTILRGHASGIGGIGVNRVAFSPTDQVLASGGQDGNIVLWDLARGERISQPLAKHSNDVNRVAFSPDGLKIASSGFDGLWLWDVKSGAELIHPEGILGPGFSGGVLGIAFSPDGKILASGGSRNDIRLWDTETGKPIGQPLLGHSDWILGLAFSPDGKTLVSGSVDKTVRLWDVVTHQPIGQPLTGHSDRVFDVAFSLDGKRLATASADNTIRLWNAATHEPLAQPLVGHTGSVYSVAFSPDGALVASSSSDGTLRLWDAASGNRIGEPLIGHRGRVKSVAFSRDGKTLASGGDDNTVMLWDVGALSPICKSLARQGRGANSLAFTPDGAKLAAGGSDGSIILLDVAKQRIIDRLVVATEGKRIIKQGKEVGWDGRSLFIESLVFSPDGHTLISGGLDGAIIFWDIATGQRKNKTLQHGGEIRSLAISKDGKVLASAGTSGEIILWNVATGGRIGKPFTGHKADIYSIAFSPDGKRLASGSFDKSIILWEVATGTPIGPPLKGHAEGIGNIAFSPDGRKLASSSRDGQIILWDIATHKAIGNPLKGAGTGDTRIAFSPDGKIIASGSTNHVVMLWDITAGEPIARPLAGPIGQIETIAFSPTAETLATGDFDGNILLWDVGIQSWESYACNRANRNLTVDEWKQFLRDEPYEKLCPNMAIHPSVILQELDHAKSMTESGSVKATSLLYTKLTQWVTETDDALLNNNVCWSGAIDGFAKSVMPACNRAVSLAPYNGGWRDSLGVARALVGDYKGAIEEFEAFVEWAKKDSQYQSYIPVRQTWIGELRAHRNPFNPATLKKLRTE